MTVLSFDPDRRTNAQLIADVHELGYLADQYLTLDCTYGEGAFWTIYRPPGLVTSDLYSPLAEYHYDFTDLPYEDHYFDVTVFDPPYGYRGTSRLKMDSKYGISGGYLSPSARDQLILDGLSESLRVSRNYVLVKVMDQVVSGKKRWQTVMIHRAIEKTNWRVVDELHVSNYIPQPSGRRQVHSHGGASTLLVLGH